MTHRCDAHAYILAVHTDTPEGLHTLSVASLDRAIAAKEWGRVAVIAQICDLTESPCIDRHEDVTAICNNYVLRIIALDIIGRVV